VLKSTAYYYIHVVVSLVKAFSLLLRQTVSSETNIRPHTAAVTRQQKRERTGDREKQKARQQDEAQEQEPPTESMRGPSLDVPYEPHGKTLKQWQERVQKQAPADVSREDCEQRARSKKSKDIEYEPDAIDEDYTLPIECDVELNTYRSMNKVVSLAPSFTEYTVVAVFEEEGNCIVCLEMRADGLMRRLISGELTNYSVVRTSPEPLQL
jgi:hypothetical protein